MGTNDKVNVNVNANNLDDNVLNIDIKRVPSSAAPISYEG